MILCGYWNTLFVRNNAQTKCLLNFITRCNLKVAWDHVDSVNGDTYVNNALGHSSRIDHFIMSENVYREILFNRITYDIDNVSTHLPVELCFCTHEFCRIKTEVDQPINIDELQWHNATNGDIINYQRVLDKGLSSLTISNALYCRTVDRSTDEHHLAIEQKCIDVAHVLVLVKSACHQPNYRQETAKMFTGLERTCSPS